VSFAQTQSAIAAPKQTKKHMYIIKVKVYIRLNKLESNFLPVPSSSAVGSHGKPSTPVKRKRAQFTLNYKL
jgi:hypothetical protein